MWEKFSENIEEVFTKEAISDLMRGLDEKSKKILNNWMKKVSLDIQVRDLDFVLAPPKYTECLKEDFFRCEEIEKKLSKAQGLPEFFPESTYFHHGMRFLPKSVKNYVKEKIFIDGGACFGDSSLAFLNYAPRKVLAFDISESNANIFRKIMKKNNVPEYKVTLILKGLGEKEERRSFQDGKGGGTGFYIQGDSFADIVTLDSCKEVDGTVGWIKIDLEGYGLPAVKGMVETIKRDRPVLTLAVYHCADELFGIKKLLESLALNYKIMFRACRFDGFNELTLIAYPAELDQV